MKRQVYLAARYTRREELLQYAAEFDERFGPMGWKVQSTWLAGEHQWNGAGAAQNGPDGLGTEIPPEAVRFAEDDWNDVLYADIVISFTEAPRSTTSRGGRHVEFGIALGLMKRCIIVGPRENVFHLLPWVDVFDSWAAAMAALESDLVAKGAQR